MPDGGPAGAALAPRCCGGGQSLRDTAAAIWSRRRIAAHARPRPEMVRSFGATRHFRPQAKQLLFQGAAPSAPPSPPVQTDDGDHPDADTADLPWPDLLRALTGLDLKIYPSCRRRTVVRLPLPLPTAPPTRAGLSSGDPVLGGARSASRYRMRSTAQSEQVVTKHLHRGHVVVTGTTQCGHQCDACANPASRRLRECCDDVTCTAYPVCSPHCGVPLT